MTAIFQSLIIASFWIFVVSCNSKNSTPSESSTGSNFKSETIDLQEESTHCIPVDSVNNYPLKYPFSAATKIIVYSFEPSENGIHASIKSGKFTLNNIEETKELTDEETKRLYSILFYTKTEGTNAAHEVYECYNPHHAIVFYENSIPIEYIELCIECRGYKTHQQTQIDFCNEKWCTLYHFFQSVGIKKTTDELIKSCGKSG